MILHISNTGGFSDLGDGNDDDVMGDEKSTDILEPNFLQ